MKVGDDQTRERIMSPSVYILSRVTFTKRKVIVSQQLATENLIDKAL